MTMPTDEITIICIDPEERTISERTILADDLNQVAYDWICEDICHNALFFKGDRLICDDMGMLHESPQPIFTILQYPNPISGRAIIYGMGQMGETRSAEHDIRWFTENVVFQGHHGVGIRVDEIPGGLEHVAQVGGADRGEGVLKDHDPDDKAKRDRPPGSM